MGDECNLTCLASRRVSIHATYWMWRSDTLHTVQNLIGFRHRGKRQGDKSAMPIFHEGHRCIQWKACFHHNYYTYVNFGITLKGFTRGMEWCAWWSNERYISHSAASWHPYSVHSFAMVQYPNPNPVIFRFLKRRSRVFCISCLGGFEGTLKWRIKLRPSKKKLSQIYFWVDILPGNVRRCRAKPTFSRFLALQQTSVNAVFRVTLS